MIVVGQPTDLLHGSGVVALELEGENEKSVQKHLNTELCMEGRKATFMEYGELNNGQNLGIKS